MESIQTLLGRRVLFFDGGMGTLLQEKGLGPGELPESWNLLHPEDVLQIHRDYVSAGADFITTNTFGANRLKMRGDYQAAELTAAGVKLARQAADEAGRPVFVALDIGPTGKLLQPMGDLDFETAVDAFKETVRAGAEAGADCAIIETMSDISEIKAAVLAVKESCSLPVFVTMVFDERGRLLTGADIPAAVAMLEGLRVDALGLNCGFGPEQMLPLMDQLERCCSIPILVSPNAGLPVVVDGQTVYNVSPADFAAQMAEIVRKGAWMVGGCCGTTPDHIRAEVEACRKLPARPLPRNRRTVVSSGSMAVVIGEHPVVIGERINPTGKKRFKQALREKDLDYLLNEGLKQVDAGADILDVNVGLPEIDETEMMRETVKGLQGVLNLPLQIDTTSPQAMEAALRVYSGKAMVNSVNGKSEVMAAVFPLVRKYGGVVVALTLDEDGIPETAEGRLAIAEKIVRTAESYGIGREDIVVDALTMTISSDQRAADTTLRALKMIKEQLGVKTVLGVSNVSFGLPRREVVNSAFLLLALEHGLDAAIINPGSERMMETIAAFGALYGGDAHCAGYIERMGAQPAPVAEKPAGEGMPLDQAVARGMKAEAVAGTRKLLETRQPMEVINEVLIPALDTVGKGFEQGTIFLPQLLMSAEAAGAAFDYLKEEMRRAGTAEEKKGKIVIATVKGDIHDIGKNIVRVLLENYGFEVIDLGKDVPPETVVETVLREDVKLVGLSALMTTTVPSMAETIRQLRAAAPDCKVVVGGAVMTQEYADQIGADCYSPDAMGTVYFAQKCFENAVKE